MATTAAQRQAAHRARQQEKLARAARIEAALATIIEKVAGKSGPVATEIRKIAEEALEP